MNPSGYCGRGQGYNRASSLRGNQHQPGHSASGQGHPCPRREAGGYRQQPLSQRSPRHYPGPARTAKDELDRAFSLLHTHPGHALDAAEVLLDSYSAYSPFHAPVCLLKARALFQLKRIDDCIAFINSLETRVQNDKGLLMAKARAFQARGFFSEALPLFQHLYINYKVTYKDQKAHGLALGRVLQLIGGSDHLEKARAVFTQLRARMAGGKMNTPCDDKDIELALGRLLQLMGGEDNLAKALAIYTRLRLRKAAGKVHTPCGDKDIELALGRLLQAMGGKDNLEKALAIYTRLRAWHAAGRVNTPCNDKDIELTLGRHLQLMGGAANMDKALTIFTQLRTWHAAGRMNTPCNDKDIELTLGRHLQLMGGADNLEKALIIYTRLRTQAAGGRANTPCNDKEIELTLGRHLQLMGGADKREQALAIYTRLRAWHAGGQVNTPCNDKEIELTLSRLFQIMGGAENLEKALVILTRLRRRSAGERVNTPCDDKEIELALGRLLQQLEGAACQDLALTIFTRLRTRAAGGRANIPCNDKDIELALATLFIERENWPAFDALRLEARYFPGFEPHLCLSIRYFSELLKTPGISPGQSRLLGQAIRSAILAMEDSGFMHASCVSQLAHCIRLLSCWPDALLRKRGIQHQDVRRLRTAAKFLFNTAEMIAPCRQRMEKDQRWRAQEQELLATLLRQHATCAPP